MFTGIIEQIGMVQENRNGRLVVEVEEKFALDCTRGASVAVNGACLTVVEGENKPGDFLHRERLSLSFDVIPETLRCSNLGVLKKGDEVNLERAMKADARFEGHIVLGHVDAKLTVQTIAKNADNGWQSMEFDLPKKYAKQSIPKGSITLDGIAFTIATVRKHSFIVALIPHTIQNTIVKHYTKGVRVNVEFDVIGKYIARIVEP